MQKHNHISVKVILPEKVQRTEGISKDFIEQVALELRNKE